MGLRGPAAQSAAMRALKNSITRKHHGVEPVVPGTADVLPDATNLVAPVGMTAVARRFWRQYAPLLAGARILSPADVEALADYCRACENVLFLGPRQRTAWRRQGRHFKLDEACRIDTQYRHWIERKTKLASELGLTPVSRVRMAWTGHAPKGGGAAPQEPAKPQSTLARLQDEARALRRPVRVAAPAPDAERG